MISGEKIYLIEPFPVDDWESLYEWLNCCSVINESDTFPKDRDQFRQQIAESLQGLRSWAVYTRDEGKLIGALMFEPFGTMAGKTYVASRRSIWGKGLMDEAGRLAINEVFSCDQKLQYIIGMVVSNNAPARSYNERLGLKLKNVIKNFNRQLGRERDLFVYEMTRDQWSSRS